MPPRRQPRRTRLQFDPTLPIGDLRDSGLFAFEEAVLGEASLAFTPVRDSSVRHPAAIRGDGYEWSHDQRGPERERAANGGEFKAWLDWLLKGDMAAPKLFTGADCELCKPIWTVEKKML